MKYFLGLYIMMLLMPVHVQSATLLHPGCTGWVEASNYDPSTNKWRTWTAERCSTDISKEYGCIKHKNRHGTDQWFPNDNKKYKGPKLCGVSESDASKMMMCKCVSGIGSLSDSTYCQGVTPPVDCSRIDISYHY